MFANVVVYGLCELESAGFLFAGNQLFKSNNFNWSREVVLIIQVDTQCFFMS